MVEQYLGILEDAIKKVLQEYFESVSTSFMEADFEIMMLKMQIALKKGHISYEEYVSLNNEVAKILKLWKKLNDVN